jgi:hypothetical protein
MIRQLVRISQKDFVEVLSRFHREQRRRKSGAILYHRFSLCGLSYGPLTVHRLKPVLLKTVIRCNTIPRGKLTS